MRQSIAPHELTLSVVVLTGSAWQYSRTIAAHGASPENIKQAALCGAWLGLLVLLRFTFVPVWLGGVVLFLLHRRIRQAVVVAVIPLVMLAPWLLRTRAIDGTIVPTRAGENLFVSSCEFAEEVVPLYDVDLMVGHAYRSVDADSLVARLPPALVERAIDEALAERAIDCLRANPLRTVRLKLRNLAYVFSPLLLPSHARLDEAAAFVENGKLRLVNIHPRPRFDTASHGIAHTGILIGAVAGLFARRRHVWDDAFLLIIVASIAGVYAVFFPTTRLTAPMTAVLMFYAGAGAGVVARRFRRKRN